jgi:putative DNA primase/helicase
MMYSWRGVGKTFIALSLAHSIASGGKLLSWTAPRPRKVLYIDGEMPARTMQERLSEIVAASETKPPTPDYFRIVTPDTQQAPIPSLLSRDLQDFADAHLLRETEVVVFDSISTLFRGGRENEAESWLPAQDWALRLRRRGLSIIFLHHEGKGGAQRGTSRREDVLDTVIHLTRPSDYQVNEGARFELHFEKARGLIGDPIKPFEARLDVRNGKAQWTVRELEDVKLVLAEELFNAGISVRDAAKELRVSKSQAHRLRTTLRQLGKLGK